MEEHKRKLMEVLGLRPGILWLIVERTVSELKQLRRESWYFLIRERVSVN